MIKQGCGALALAIGASARRRAIRLSGISTRPIRPRWWTRAACICTWATTRPAMGKDYVMNEWLVYSSCDMVRWTAHGSPLRYSTFAWAGRDAWAGDIVKRDGKYYFYATVDHKSVPGKAIGVAVSDSPTGPFTDARGTALVTNDMTKQTDIMWDDIDPGVFIDDDGQAWLYWGNTVLKYARLKPNMTELDGPIMSHQLASFTEAPYVHRRGKTYYLSYSLLPGGDRVRHRRKSGRAVDLPRRDHEKNHGVKTIHQAIIDFNGKSYIFYHNAKLPGGAEFRRSVAVEELHYARWPHSAGAPERGRPGRQSQRCLQVISESIFSMQL
ncbi:family 43 glycosylhydrolase [Massilia sp. B-10]|nr:family 43 glycosylhydrolase [Massilia sp. B-10]